MRFLSVPAAYLVLADLLFGLVGNVKSALLPSAAPLPKDGLPVSPEFAFGWLQVLANGGMALVVGLALLSVLAQSRSAARHRMLVVNGWRQTALLIVAVFAAPALWQWLWAFVDFAQGRLTVSFADPRYLAVAICQPWLLLLAYSTWRGQRRLRRAVLEVPPVAETFVGEAAE